MAHNTPRNLLTPDTEAYLQDQVGNYLQQGDNFFEDISDSDSELDLLAAAVLTRLGSLDGPQRNAPTAATSLPSTTAGTGTSAFRPIDGTPSSHGMRCDQFHQT